MTNEEFKQLRDETVPKVKLSGWDITCQLCPEGLDGGSKGLCRPDGRYRTARIYLSMPALKDADPFAVRTLIIHEVIHTYFSFYKDFLEDLSPSVSMNVLGITKNACLYQEEQIIEELAKRMHEIYRKEEREKNKYDFGLSFTP